MSTHEFGGIDDFQLMSSEFQIKHLIINFNDASIKSYGANIKIDNMAVAVLKILIENHGKTVNNEYLMESVWNKKPSSPEVIPAAISRLRRMFKKTGVGDSLITTVHKVGYRLDLPEPDPSQPEPTYIGIKSHIPFNMLIISILLATAISVYIFRENIFNLNNTPITKVYDEDRILKNSELQSTQLYILRHTEKVSAETEDPELSEKGIKHAGYWKKVLQHIKFDEVYTTDFKRNVQTAKIIIGNDNYPLKYYYPMSFDVVHFLNKVKGEKVLIIGHSNTIPDMVNRLIGSSLYPPMSHKNYNQLYHVTISQQGEISSDLLHIEMPD